MDKVLTNYSLVGDFNRCRSSYLYSANQSSLRHIYAGLISEGIFVKFEKFEKKNQRTYLLNGHMGQNLPTFISCMSNFVLFTSEQQQTSWADRKLTTCDKDITIVNYPAIRPDNTNYPAGYRIVEKSTIRSDSLSGASLVYVHRKLHFSKHSNH